MYKYIYKPILTYNVYYSLNVTNYNNKLVIVIVFMCFFNS